jgi:hypothetical protein
MAKSCVPKFGFAKTKCEATLVKNTCFSVLLAHSQGQCTTLAVRDTLCVTHGRAGDVRACAELVFTGSL